MRKDTKKMNSAEIETHVQLYHKRRLKVIETDRVNAIAKAERVKKEFDDLETNDIKRRKKLLKEMYKDTEK